MRAKILFCSLAAICAAASPSLFGQVFLQSADDAARIALSNDREGALRRKEAKEEMRLAKSSVGSFLPEFDFSFSNSAYSDIESGGWKKKTLEVGVTQKIFNGGRSVSEWKIQKEKSLYNFLEVQKSQDELKKKAFQAYHQALVAKLKADLLRGAAETAQEVFLVAELEEAQGLISTTEFLESAIRYKEIKAKAKMARDEFFDLSRSLCELMNVRADMELVFAEADCDAFFEKPYEPEKFLERARGISRLAAENSLDLKRAKAEFNWAKKRKSLQARAFLPSVSLRAGLSASGSGYPLDGPSYSLKVILGFDNNPWLPVSASKSAGVQDGELVSVADAITGKGIINTSWPSQMRLLKIAIEKCRMDIDSVEKAIESAVFKLARQIDSAQEAAALSFETAKLKEQKLLVCKIQLEQGEIKKTDYLEALDESAAEKINCVQNAAAAASLKKELEILADSKL